MNIKEEYKRLTSQFAEFQISLQGSEIYKQLSTDQKAALDENFVSTTRTLSATHTAMQDFAKKSPR